MNFPDINYRNDNYMEILRATGNKETHSRKTTNNELTTSCLMKILIQFQMK